MNKMNSCDGRERALLWLRHSGLVVAILLCACRRDREPIVTSAEDSLASDAITDVNESIAFVERSKELGVVATYRNGEEQNHCTLLESLGGGVGWFDFDRDGWLDLVTAGGGIISQENQITGLSCALFQNRSGQAFQNVFQQAGFHTESLYSHGIAIGDFDNDGFPDLIVTGYGVPQLWHNAGDGTLILAAGLGSGIDDRWSSSAGWADLNGDGNLDLYLARYVNWSFENHPFCQDSKAARDICPPRSFEGLPDSVYFSNGSGSFRDVSAEIGLRTDGKGLGVLLADVDLDGDVDAYVANDTTDNFLYFNDGRGSLEEGGLLSGVALDDNGIPNGSMGIDLCDFNRDGLPDIWVTNYEREYFAIYRNEGRGQFLHVSRRYGITDLGGLFVGFGTVCEDFNTDGFTDIVVANGHVIKFPDASPRMQLPLYLRFNGERFQREQAANGSYFDTVHEGRGAAAGDYDGDGDIDLAVSHLNAPVAVLENKFIAKNHSILVELIGTSSNRDAVGARVDLFQDSGPPMSRQIVGGGSYLSHSDRRLNFTLPDTIEMADDAKPFSDLARLLRLTVQWPSGTNQTLTVPSTNRFIRIVEPLASDAQGLQRGRQP